MAESNMTGSNNNCDALLNQVYQTGFAMDDVVLYLDTHPGDRDALNYYFYIVDLNKRAIEAYEAQCGPLMANQVNSENYWSWVNDPWPWEGVCG